MLTRVTIGAIVVTVVGCWWLWCKIVRHLFEDWHR